MDTQQLQRIVEGALLAAGTPLSIKRLSELFEEGEAPEKEAFEEALAAIAAQCEGRGYQLKEVGSGWRLQVEEDLAPWINRLWEEKPQKYSRALLETLALIAYRQPITRGDIEEIRGVAVSSHIIKTLVERNWVKAVGHRDVPGRPSLYATTRSFLDYFNLKSLDELPTLSDIRDLDEINASLDLDMETALRGGEGDNSDEESEPATGTETTDIDEEAQTESPAEMNEAEDGGMADTSDDDVGGPEATPDPQVTVEGDHTDDDHSER